MKRSMDTSLNTHMKQNCKQIFFYADENLRSQASPTVQHNNTDKQKNIVQVNSNTKGKIV